MRFTVRLLDVFESPDRNVVYVKGLFSGNFHVFAFSFGKIVYSWGSQKDPWITGKTAKAVKAVLGSMA